MHTPKKKSKQRDAILSCVKSHHDHPTADDIFHEIQKSIPHISLGTVYRNLGLLSQTHQIRKITGKDHTDHFDGNVEDHAHFICHSCGNLFDLPLALPTNLIEEASQIFPGWIQQQTLLFEGLCEDCLRETKEKSSLPDLNRRPAHYE